MDFRPFLFIPAFFLLLENIQGQCCSAGNPAGGNSINDALPARELMILTTYKHSLSDTYFHKDHETEVPLIDKSYYDYQSLSFYYGIFQWMNVSAEIGYFYNKTQLLKTGQPTDEIRAHGLGDLGINLRFIPFKAPENGSMFIVSGGLRLPVGDFNKQTDGVTVPVSLQPSSGALKINANLYYSQFSKNRKFSVNSFAMYEYSNAIEKGYYIYKYGDFLQLSSGAQYTIIKQMAVIMNVKYEWRGQDHREDNIIVQSSGSHIILVSPQLTFYFKPGWSLLVLSDIPVYKYVYGDQLTNSFAIQATLSKKFNLNKKSHEIYH
jgi:hypothetical protein